MKDSTLGIYIILGIIVIGIASGGKIFGVKKSDDSTNNVQNSSKYTSYQTDADNDIQAIYRDGDSIYSSASAGSVTMRISQPNTFKEYITLTARGNSGTAINITGWKVRSTVTGENVVIGTGNPLPSFENGNQNIVLRKGERALLYSNNGAIDSFKLNKCTGYFEQNGNFFPTLPQKCPRPETLITPSSPLYFKDSCIDIIQSIPRCIEYDEDDLPKNITNMCESFIEENANYNGCVLNHRNDSDFFGKEWRVYPDKNHGILWRKDKEHIELLDASGNVVDAISY